MSLDRVDQEDQLAFAFLVYMEESERWGATWFARSVLTGHLAEGRTPDSAVANLQRTIDAEIGMAARLGKDAQEWFESLRPDDPEFVEAWCRLAAAGHEERRTFDLKSTPGRLSATIVTKAA